MEQGESEYFPHVESAKTSKQCLIFRNRFTLPIELEELIMKYYNEIRSEYLDKVMSQLSTKSLIEELMKRDCDPDGTYFHRMYKTYSNEMRRLYGIPHDENELCYSEQQAHGVVNMSINYNRLINGTIFNIDVYNESDVYGIVEELLFQRYIMPRDGYGRYVVDFYDHILQNDWHNKSEHERRVYVSKLFPTIKFNFIKDYGLVSFMRQRNQFTDVVYRTMRMDCINKTDMESVKSE